MNRIEKKFQDLRRRRKKAFLAFITAGYPDLETTKRLALEFTKAGVDILELGVPFSDPMADGPLIQEASQVALKKKVHLNEILNLVKELRKYTAMPICLMTYYNPIFCFGEELFVNKATSCGVDGVIIPDLPPEEGQVFLKLAQRVKLDTILFLSPTSTRDRIRQIAKAARGFIYYVSLTGVTGPRKELPTDMVKNLKKIKGITAKPICVGFGVSRAEQIRQIYRVADGVIVGSAIIKKIRENLGKKDLVRRVGKFVAGLSATGV